MVVKVWMMLQMGEVQRDGRCRVHDLLRRWSCLLFAWYSGSMAGSSARVRTRCFLLNV